MAQREAVRMPLEDVRDWIDQARRVVVLTGAGISTESGIPDFRGPDGLWTRNPEAEKLSSIHHYLADPEVRKASWRSRLQHPAFAAQPNAGHAALVALEQRGKLHALITQNIDIAAERLNSPRIFSIPRDASRPETVRGRRHHLHAY
jgi:NAD-dependent deacetylase